MKIELVSDFNVNNLTDKAFALAAYIAIDKFYPYAKEIKKNAKLTDNVLEVKTFKAVSMLTGKDPYSLKSALVSSDRTKVINGEKQLAVPINGKVVTMTEHSKGWMHPGFDKKYFKDYIKFISSIQMLKLITE